jgi:ABC-2 type transport system permease protein
VEKEQIMRGTYTVWLRNIKRFLRSKSRIIGSLGPPLLILFVIGFGLNSVINISGGTSYVGFLIPGIISMSILFASIFSGIQIIWDKQFGFLKETLVAPVSRFEIMLGQTLGGATTSFLQGLLIMIISLAIELHTTTVMGFLTAFVFMILVGIAFTALGVAIASRMDDMSGFNLIMNFVVFPIFALSGALFPISSLPSWAKTVTLFDPLTYGVDGIRNGLLGASSINPMLDLLVISGFAIIMIFVGSYSFKKMKF